VLVPGLDLDNSQSDSYLDWVVLDREHWFTVYPETQSILKPRQDTTFAISSAHRREWVLLDSLTSGNLIVAESDQRAGSQVQALFTRIMI